MHLLPFLQAGNHLARCFLDLALKQADIPAVLCSHCHVTWPSHHLASPFIILKVRTLKLRERLSEMLLVLTASGAARLAHCKARCSLHCADFSVLGAFVLSLHDGGDWPEVTGSPSVLPWGESTGRNPSLPGLVDQVSSGFPSLAFIPRRPCLCWVPASVRPRPHQGGESAQSER